MKNVLAPSLVLVLFIGGWHVVVSSGLVPSFLLPSPEQVLQIIKEMQADLLAATISTAKAAVIGFTLSFMVGLLLALLLSSSKLLNSAVLPFAAFFQTVPVVAIAPLLVIWFGFGSPTVIAASLIVSFFPMLANCLMGFSLKDDALSEMLVVFRASRWQRFFYLQLPLALPSIISGLKVSAGLSVVGALVGEFVAGGGLGGLIDSARTQQRVDLVFSALIFSSLVGLFFVSVVDFLQWLILRWRPFYDVGNKRKY